MTQSTDAAERSAHVTRGPATPPLDALDPFVGPAFGPVKLRAVADLGAEVARLRAALKEIKGEAWWSRDDYATQRTMRLDHIAYLARAALGETA